MHGDQDCLCAVVKKANSRVDLISLFQEEYSKLNPGGKLAPLFAARSNTKLKFDASDEPDANVLIGSLKISSFVGSIIKIISFVFIAFTYAD